MMKSGVKVRLKKDLTKYKQGLTAGSEGVTCGNYGDWSRSSDLFTMVDFGIIRLDVVIDQLDIIDENYLAELDEIRKKKFEEYKTATNIVKRVGPRGGFKSLSFKYIAIEGHSINTSIGSRNTADSIVEFFEENKMPVKQEVV